MKYIQIGLAVISIIVAVIFGIRNKGVYSNTGIPGTVLSDITL